MVVSEATGVRSRFTIGHEHNAHVPKDSNPSLIISDWSVRCSSLNSDAISNGGLFRY